MDTTRSYLGLSVTAFCCLAACSEKAAMEMSMLPGDTVAGGGGAAAATTAGNGGAPATTGGAGAAGGSSSVAGAGAGAGQGGTLASAGTGGLGGSAAGTGGAGAAGAAGAAGMNGGDDDCSREALKASVDAYFTALAAHDASQLPLAADVKLTENGEQIAVDEGMWMTAGMVSFALTAVDTDACSTVTEAVVPDGSSDIPFGLRLKHVGGEITEIETVAVRSGDYFVASNTGAIAETDVADWETVLPIEDQTPREQLEKMVNDYFMRFPVGACGFASDCTRLENGFSPGACVDGSLVKCDMNGMGSIQMDPRLILSDVEAGIVVGFVMFAGSYTDFHMFKVTAGEVHSVHAVLGSASASGWD